MSSPPSGPPPPYYGGPYPYQYWNHWYPPRPRHVLEDHHPHPPSAPHGPPFGPGPHGPLFGPGPHGPTIRPGSHSPPFGPGPHSPHKDSSKEGYGWHPPSHCSGSYMWVEGRDGSVPHNAVKVGVDKDGSPIFAGRAFHEGDLLPAKVAPAHGGAFVAWGGAEHSKFEYEVLCSTHVGWTGAVRGEVPPEAICVGQTSSGEKLYMGRVMHEGTLTPGKIQPSHGVLYIPYGGLEVSFPEYEVMVLM